MPPLKQCCNIPFLFSFLSSNIVLILILIVANRILYGLVIWDMTSQKGLEFMRSAFYRGCPGVS